MTYAKEIKLDPARCGERSCSAEEWLAAIEQIHLAGPYGEGWYDREAVHELVKGGRTVCVDIHPYPELVPVIENGVKLVRTSRSAGPQDPLLRLPRI